LLAVHPLQRLQHIIIQVILRPRLRRVNQAVHIDGHGIRRLIRLCRRQPAPSNNITIMSVIDFFIGQP